jgi:hypothetical protein
MTDNAEQQVDQRNVKELYDLRRKLAGKYRRPERPIKDSQGQTIMYAAKQLERWVELFKELLNRPTPENPTTIPEANGEFEIDCEVSSEEETVHAINEMKNGKADGPEADIETTAEILLPLFEGKRYHPIEIRDT